MEALTGQQDDSPSAAADEFVLRDRADKLPRTYMCNVTRDYVRPSPEFVPDPSKDTFGKKRSAPDSTPFAVKFPEIKLPTPFARIKRQKKAAAVAAAVAKAATAPNTTKTKRVVGERRPKAGTVSATSRPLRSSEPPEDAVTTTFLPPSTTVAEEGPSTAAPYGLTKAGKPRKRPVKEADPQEQVSPDTIGHGDPKDLEDAPYGYTKAGNPRKRPAAGTKKQSAKTKDSKRDALAHAPYGYTKAGNIRRRPLKSQLAKQGAVPEALAQELLSAPVQKPKSKPKATKKENTVTKVKKVYREPKGERKSKRIAKMFV